MWIGIAKKLQEIDSKSGYKRIEFYCLGATTNLIAKPLCAHSGGLRGNEIEFFANCHEDYIYYCTLSYPVPQIVPHFQSILTLQRGKILVS